MLKTDKPIYKVILILNLLFIFVGCAIAITDLTGTDTIGVIYTVTEILALLFALFYILYGYTKNAAGYYKVFGYLYLLSRISDFIKIISSNRKVGIFTYIFWSIVTISLLVLVFGKNLGKKKSLILCGVIVLIGVIGIFYVYNQTGAFHLGAKIRLLDLDLACLYGILTYAKYLDKESRGAK